MRGRSKEPKRLKEPNARHLSFLWVNYSQNCDFRNSLTLIIATSLIGFTYSCNWFLMHSLIVFLFLPTVPT